MASLIFFVPPFLCAKASERLIEVIVSIDKLIVTVGREEITENVIGLIPGENCSLQVEGSRVEPLEARLARSPEAARAKAVRQRAMAKRGRGKILKVKVSPVVIRDLCVKEI